MIRSRKDAFQDALAGPLGCELKARAMNTQMGGGVLKIRVMKKPKSKEPSAKRAKVGKGEKVGKEAGEKWRSMTDEVS
ncbi:hypothetical protein P8452_50806 [Trifolium repens]|nr:hypothetical protein P8452_50806 [Trifolium repens]